MKILAFGDAQIGLGTKHGRFPGDRLKDQADVLDRIADLAIERRVDLVLNGGDTFEGPETKPEHLDAFARFIAKLHAAGIPTLAVTGNGRHDLAVRETTGMAIFDHVPGVVVAARPDVFHFNGCMVGALPWVSTARRVAAQNGGDRDEINAEVAQLVLRIAEGLYEDCRRVAPAVPAVLLMHWSISGASTPSGLPADAMREPVVPLLDLAAIGFDAIVASHIHRPQFAVADEHGPLGWLTPKEDGDTVTGPLALYTGSPMCHDFGEEGHPHGVWILDLAHGPQPPQAVNGAGESASPVRCEFVPVQSRPFVTIDLDVADDPDQDAVEFLHSNLVCPPSLDGAVVRLRITATASQMRRADSTRIVDTLLAAGAHVIKLDPKTVHESRARVTDVERPDEITEAEWLDRWLDVSETPEDARADVRAVFAGYLETAQ